MAPHGLPVRSASRIGKGDTVRVWRDRCRLPRVPEPAIVAVERGVLIACAALGFAATAAIGAHVARRPPGPIDLRVARLYGHGVRPARFFTALGRTWALVTISALVAVACVLTGGNGTTIGIVLASQILSQGAAAWLKARFARPRPTAWLVRLELGRSFPSGHATTAVVYYLPLALLAYHGSPHAPADLVRGAVPASAANALAAALVLGCACGIPWSRIVLGAHFASDVAGGLVFGASWTLATAAFLLP